jgi:hypothetical protein
MHIPLSARDFPAIIAYQLGLSGDVHYMLKFDFIYIAFSLIGTHRKVLI